MNNRKLFIRIAALCMVFASSVAIAKNKITEKEGKVMLNGALLFTENKGQITDDAHKQRADILFAAHNDNTSIFLTTTGIKYQFTTSTRGKKTDTALQAQSYNFSLTLEGANPSAHIRKEDKDAFTENFYSAANPDGITNVPTYKKVVYEDVYPHIDWVVYSHGNHLKYDFIVKPGGNPGQIKLKIKDALSADITPGGDLLMKTTLGEVREQAPVSYADGHKVTTKFKENKDGSFGFEVGAFSTGSVLTIDPSVSWATYYGSTGTEQGWGTVTDAAGNVYLSGLTTTAGSALSTPGAFQASLAGAVDAFLVKFDATGTRLWATYYGGTLTEFAPMLCAVDTAGNVFLSGSTTSSTGLATTGAYQTALNGTAVDLFLAKFDASGARQWATYFGGPGTEGQGSCATDISGNIYICGSTTSTTGIATGSAYQTAFGGGTNDAFIAKFNAGGTLQWSTYYGGTGSDQLSTVRSCATDLSGNVYLCGGTTSTSAIASSGAYQSTLSGSIDGFLVKFDSSGNRQWGTYFGGPGSESVVSCATDKWGNPFLCGTTASTTSLSSCGFQSVIGGGTTDAFLAKFNASGAFKWSTYYGGTGIDGGTSCAADASGNIFMVGSTASTAGISSTDGFQPTFVGTGTSADGYIVKFDSLGSRKWASYYGGTGVETGTSCTISPSGDLYFAGYTTSPSLPMATEPTGDGTDAFLAKIATGNVTEITTGAITGSPFCPGASVTVPFTATGTYVSGNIFSAQLSDANGSFCNAVVIGSISAISSGSITGTIPVGAGVGSGYRIRVISNYPVNGQDNGSDLKINPIAGTISGAPSMLPGQIINFTSSGASGGTWSSSATSVATIDPSSGVLTALAGTTAYSSAHTTTLNYAATSACGSGTAVLTVTVNPSFTPNNLLVYRTNGNTSNSTSISLVEYTTSGGAAVSTSTLVATSTYSVSASGTTVNEGMMSLDAEHTHLVLPAYNALSGVGVIANTTSTPTNNRELLTMSPAMSLSLAYSNASYTGKAITAGTTTGGEYYASGGSGVVLMNTGTSTIAGTNISSTAATTSIQVINGQLYYAMPNPGSGLFMFSSPVPLAATTATNILSGGSGTSPFGFAISPDGNTLYLADDGVGIKKYTKTGGAVTFTFQYNITVTTCRGLTVDFTATPYTVYATTAAASSNAIIKIVDNGAAATAVTTTIVSGATTTNFRGITFTPQTYAAIKAATASICPGNTDTVFIYGNPGATVRYSDGSATNSVILDATGESFLIVSPAVTTTYSLISETTSLGTFVVTGSAVITASSFGAPVISSLSADASVCAGNTLHLSAAVTSGVSPYNYSWSGPSSYTATASSASSTNSVTVTSISGTPATPVYTVIITDAHGCVAAGTNTVSTTVHSLLVYTVSSEFVSSNGYCAGGSGVPVGLTNSQTGVNYQLYDGATAEGGPVAGTGSAISFGSQLAAGTYTVLATDMVTGCTAAMSGSAGIAIWPVPNVTSITIDPSVCAGNTLHMSTAITSGGATGNFTYIWSGPSLAVNTSFNSLTSSVTCTAPSGIPMPVYTLTVKDATHFCIATGVSTVTTTVLPAPSAGTITGVLSLIPGQITTLSNGGADAGGAWISSTPAHVSINASGTVNAVAIGTSTITYSVTAGGCTNVSTNIVTVTAAFGSGNLIVLQQNGITTSASSVSLLEYATTGGAFIDSIQFPSSTVSPRLTQPGTGTIEEQGFMTLDAEGTHIIVPGYDAAAGTANVGSSAPKVVFSVLPSRRSSAVCLIPSASCYGRDFASATAAIISGSTYYFGAGESDDDAVSGGLRLLGASSSSLVSSVSPVLRLSAIYNGQLYTSSGYVNVPPTIGIYQVGIGIPTSSATGALITGGTGAGTSPYAFSISPDGNTMYVADDGAGLQKFIKSGSTFTFAYNLTTTKCRGLVVDYTTTPYTVYATTAATSANSVIKISDAAPYTVTAIVTGTSTTRLKGITFSPASYAKIQVTTPLVCNGTPDTVIFYGNSGATIDYTANGVPASIVLPASGMGLLIVSVTANTTYSLSDIVNTLGTFSVSGSATITLGSFAGPSLTSIGADAQVCAGSTLNLTAAISSGTAPYNYIWSGPSSYTTTTNSSSLTNSATVDTIHAIPASPVYTLTARDANNCIASGTNTVTTTVNSIPSVYTVTGTGSYCDGTTGTDIQLSNSQSGINYQLFNTGGAVGTVVTSAAGAIDFGNETEGDYYVVATNGITGCVGTMADTAVVTAIPLPLAYSITGGGSVCGAGAGVFIGLDNSQVDVSYRLYNGATPVGDSVLGTGTDISFGTYSATGTYSVIATTIAGGCNTNMMGNAIITPAANQWNGSASADWNTNANWSCGSTPVATQNVIIPGATFYVAAPVLNSGSGYANDLTIAATAVVTLDSGSQLNIAGNLANSSAISGDNTVPGGGIVVLNGNSSQLISGSGSICNLTLANSAGAVLSTAIGDTLSINGTLLLNAGSLSANGRLMLLSTADRTASIGTITGGSITGNVVIQQYIPGDRRAYRFWAHPFDSAVSLGQIENFIDITGVAGSVNGFTTTTSNAPSAYWYNTMYGNSSMGTDPGWRAFTSTFGAPDSNLLHQYQGMRLYIRGSKGEGLFGETYIPSPTTIRMWGKVNTGIQTEVMVKGTGDNADYNLLGNPYPAITDLGMVIAAANDLNEIAGTAFYVWNPHLNTSGQFVPVIIGGHYYLGPNESFEVRTMDNNNTLVFNESDKADTVSAMLMRSAASDYLELNIYDSTYHLWDMLYIKFDAAATAGEDIRYDAMKPPSPATFNFFSLSADNKKLSVDARPFNEGGVIPLGMSSSYTQDLIIRADNLGVPSGSKVYLHDKLLQTYTLLQQGTEYKFSITQATGTQGNDRFELRMGAPALDDLDNSGLTVTVMPNPVTDKVTIDYATDIKAATTLRILNTEGVVVLTQDLGIQQLGSIQLPVAQFASGVYLLEFTSGTHKVVKQLVKE